MKWTESANQYVETSGVDLAIWFSAGTSAQTRVWKSLAVSWWDWSGNDPRGNKYPGKVRASGTVSSYDNGAKEDNGSQRYRTICQWNAGLWNQVCQTIHGKQIIEVNHPEVNRQNYQNRVPSRKTSQNSTCCRNPPKASTKTAKCSKRLSPEERCTHRFNNKKATIADRFFCLTAVKKTQHHKTTLIIYRLPISS